MDRRRRNLRLELNKAFYRALDMPTVGPNSYAELFEQAQNVCLLKLPNDPAITYEGIDRVKATFINAASKVYFGTSTGQITFAFYNSFQNDKALEKPLHREQENVVNFYRARLRIAGKKHEISSSFAEAFKQGITSIGSIETLDYRGKRNLLDIPNLTKLAAARYHQEGLEMPDNTVVMGYISDHDIIKSINHMGVDLMPRDEVISRVIAERYGTKPNKSNPPALGR